MLGKEFTYLREDRQMQEWDVHNVLGRLDTIAEQLESIVTFVEDIEGYDWSYKERLHEIKAEIDKLNADIAQGYL
jgi:peptidoglycan hydrolase CwlO-like protein